MDGCGSKSRAHPGKGLLHLPRCPQQLGIAGNRIPMGTRASRGSDRRSERASLNQSMPGGLRRRVLGSMGRHEQAGQLRSRTHAMLPPPIRQCLDAPSTDPRWHAQVAWGHRLRHLYLYPDCLIPQRLWPTRLSCSQHPGLMGPRPCRRGNCKRGSGAS